MASVAPSPGMASAAPSPGMATSSSPATDLSPDEVYDAFLAWATSTGRPPYPHQDEAALSLITGDHVVLATPTGSGKTLVAIAALYSALATGRRGWYTAPIKALVSEKFFEMIDVFGADNVGMITGDSTVNPDAPIICCTAEILAMQALHHGARADVGVAVLDEFHYYGDRQRGWAWQVPLIELPHTQFLLMSGTLGDVSDITADLTVKTGRDTALITGVQRPVPLSFEYHLYDVPEAVNRLVEGERAPIYVVHFTQASAIEQAQGLVGSGLVPKQDRQRIAEVIGDFRFAKGFGRTLSRLVRAGIGVHHAGMLPRYRRLVERLAQEGLLAVICGTDTLGVGINVPIRTVLLTALAKYDGHKSRILTAREFHQIAGRAGRAGYDTQGFVQVLAPADAVEKAKADAKAAAKAAQSGKSKGRAPKKSKKTPSGKDKEIRWTQQTFDRLTTADPEPLGPHLRITHTIVLALLSREQDVVRSLRHLIEESHESRRRQIALIRRAIAIGRSLLDAGIVLRLDVPDEFGRRFILTASVQLDFALDQPLSPLALATIELLDAADDGYALDAVSVIESTLPAPMPVLIAQRKRARDQAMSAMRAEDLDYTERMNRLDKIDYPMPCAELIDAAYLTYKRGNPWVAEYQIQPKSIVREMFSRGMTFSEYISEYQLSRSEGLVLRYLAQAYRALKRTIPVTARTDELQDIISWLGEVVRGIDSSLLAEWEALIHPDADEVDEAGGRGRNGYDDFPATGDARGGTARGGAAGSSSSSGISANRRAFTIMIRNALFRRLELAARGDWRTLGEIDGEAGFDADTWYDALVPYFADHETIGIDAAARAKDLIDVIPGPDSWTARQIIDDPDGHHDWAITAEVDVAESDEVGEPAIRIVSVSDELP